MRSGYSLSVANRGPRGYLDNKPGIVKDFEQAAEESAWKPETLKKIVTHRLATSVVEGRPSNVAREAELLGKMKEVDMFVRTNEGGAGMNVLSVLINEDGATDALCERVSEYENFVCDWCHAEVEGKARFQAHALVCSKRPMPALPQP